jgi:hypothetical protein
LVLSSFGATPAARFHGTLRHQSGARASIPAAPVTQNA